MEILNSTYNCSITNCNFFDNRYSIASVWSGIERFVIDGTFFYGTGNPLLGTTNEYAKWGILLGYSTTPFEFSNPTTNDFSNLQVGIYSGTTFTTINPRTCYFHDIPNGLFPIGIALYSGSQVRGFDLVKKGDLSSTDFKHCNMGIKVWRTNAIIENNIFTNQVTAINIEQSHDLVKILNNNIEFNNFGIDIHNCNQSGFGLPGNRMHINGNTLTDISTTENYTNTGIRINETILIPQLFEVRNNTVFMNYGVYGIYHNTGNYAIFKENSIYLNNPYANWAGIGVFNANYADVECNYVYGIQGTETIGDNGTRHPIGIEVVQSNFGNYGFNQVRDLFTGIAFEDNCFQGNQGNIFRNLFSTHDIGLYYNVNAATPFQPNSGNAWVGSYNTRKVQGNGSASPEYTVGIGPAKFNPLPSVNPTAFFFYDPSVRIDDVNSPCALPGGGMMKRDSSLTKSDTTIAIKNLTFSNFNEEQTWMASRNLYDKLLRNDSLLIGNELMTNFQDSVSLTTAGQYQEVEIAGKSAFASNVVDLQTIENLQRLLQENIIQTGATDSLLNTHPFAEDSILLLNNLRQLHFTYRLLSKELQAALKGYDNLVSNKLDLVIADNNQLISNKVFEENEKIVNRIYFNMFTRPTSEFSQNELADLWYVASQCPISGGKAVYLARSLYSIINDTIFNDHNLCLEAGIIKSQSNQNAFYQEMHFSTYPNPTNGRFTLSWNLPIPSNCEIRICNLLGELVSSQTISLKSGNEDIDVNNLKAGVYMLSATYNAKTIRIGKITLIK